MKVYTKQEVKAMRRGPSLYAPVIVNFLSGRTMLFHDAEGGSIRIADDVTPKMHLIYGFAIKQSNEIFQRIVSNSQSKAQRVLHTLLPFASSNGRVHVPALGLGNVANMLNKQNN